MNLNIALTAEQTLAMTACMLAVSHIDGAHPSETSLIKTFYEEGRNGGPAFEEVQKMYTQAAALLQKLPANKEFADALVGMCLMVAYADGSLTQPERDTVSGFAQSLGMSTETFDNHLQMVRDSLLGSLSSLPDAASVAALAKEL